MWKLSFPTCLVRYLLQAIRDASRASEEICSTQSETMWTTQGKSPIGAFFLPMSQIRILESGTPRLYLDLGYGFPLHTLQHLAGLLPIQNVIIIINQNNIIRIFSPPTPTPTPMHIFNQSIFEPQLSYINNQLIIFQCWEIHYHQFKIQKMKITPHLLLLLLFASLVCTQDTPTSLTKEQIPAPANNAQAAVNTQNAPSNQQVKTEQPVKTQTNQQSQTAQAPQTDSVPHLTQVPASPTQAANSNDNTGTLESPKLLLNSVNKPIVSKGYKIDQGISYQRIKLEGLQKKYLFFNFKLSEKDKWQKVNITITNEGESKILNRCEYTGLDSCYIPAFTLKTNATLFVHIQCQDDCTYNLNAQWSDTEHLLPGEDVVFMFGKDTTQIYHVELEDQEDFEEVRIHLAPRVTRKPFDNIKIYGKYGKDVAPTPTSYDFKSINLWQDGEGIFLKKSSLKEKKFVLLIVGQTETTYKLTLELVQEESHEIENGEHIYEYLQANSEKVYHIQSIPNVFQEYSLRFSTLSGGNLSIGYFTDKNLTKSITFQPFEYMKDSEYILSSKRVLEPYKEGIYLQVKTNERSATYTIKFIGRNEADSIQLNQHVYGFITINQARFAHFDFKRWAGETDSSQNLKFTAYVIGVYGSIKPEFFVCQSTLGLCTNPKFYINNTVPIPSKPHDTISQKQLYDLTIDDKVLKKINAAEEQATIIIRFSLVDPLKNQGFNLVAVELVNNNKVLYLREGRPLEEKLGEKEMKIYKYINSDPNVQEIRIHVNEIAGHVSYSGVIQGDDKTGSIQVFPESNTLRFTKNLTQPIYASVVADSKAIFGISMQVIHKSQTSSVNIVSISEDLTYTVKIQPNTYAIYEIIPIFYDFRFTYAASQSVIVCSINPQTKSCIEPNSAFANPTLGVKGEITNPFYQNRKARIKITNPFSDSIAEVSFIFHSRRLNHCENKNIGQVYNEVVKDTSCFSYLLQEDNKIVDLYISKREFGSLSYSVLLCGNEVPGIKTAKTIEISPALIAKSCQNSEQGRKLSIVWSVSTKNIANKDEKSVIVDVLAQYRGNLIVLTQGVSYNKIAKVQQGFLAKFAYNLINKKDTKIILNQIRGRFKVYAKLVNQNFKERETISNINYHFISSQTLDYSQEPIIQIREQDIKNEKCIDCSILIAVYSQDDYGTEVEFDIQIVQRYYSLSEDTAVDGYLDAGSFAYYSYLARQEDNSTIIVLLSDHNKQCANMYLSLLENPGPTSHIAKAIAANELIFRHPAGEKKYYLSVQATKVCDYTISVLTIDSSINNLKRGRQNLIKFPRGVVKYFYMDHYTSQPFKIITLTKYGEVKLYLNQSFINVNKKTFTTEEIELSKFAFRSEQSNTLSIDANHPQFCEKCSYFIALQALKNTEATLYLVYPQTTITLTEGHFLSDHLAKKDDYTLATYNRLEKTQINIKIHSGSLNIMAVFKEQTISSKFETSDSMQNFVIDFESQIKKAEKGIPEADVNLGAATGKSVSTIERIPINFMIIATSPDTSYTLEMKSLANSSKLNELAVYQTLIPGEPNGIEVSSSKALCLTGYLRQANEQLILSANNENKQFFGQLIMQASINGNKAEISKTFTRNIIGITLTLNDKQQGVMQNQFELCLKLAQPQPKTKETTEDTVQEVETEDAVDDEIKLNAIITQVNTVNILPTDTDSVVKGASTYVIHSEGEFLLDVFECKGEAKVNYGNSLANIEKTKLKMLDMVNMPDQRHAIKISQKETTFVKVESEHSIVRWLPIDYENERGLGYMKFQSGDLRYSSKFKEISVEYQPLQQSKKTSSKVRDVEYKLYISNSSESIEFASQCETSSEDVQVLVLQSPALSNLEYSVKTIEKEQLEKIYPGSENIYFNIVAVLTLNVQANDSQAKLPSSDEHEHYRFIYNRQQIPLASYQQNQIESIPYHFLILLVISIGAILVLFTYLFTRKIVPLLARLKNSNLVEEEPAQQHKDDLEVPASSDRNQRAPDIAVQTEQRMGK